MNHLPATPDPSQVETTQSIGESKPESIASTWVTSLSCLICIGIFLGLASRADAESWSTLALFGYLPANFIWNGHYWALLTSVFVHLALWHVALNVYWLWTLGSRLERTIGSVRFLIFFLISAFVSSTFELAFSDSTGIGASGVVYAIFGFMWVTRGKYSLFKQTLDSSTVRNFVVWLFICIATTATHVLDVANIAHFSGLLIGFCLGWVSSMQKHHFISIPVSAFMILFPVVLCFWCPWSITWLSVTAYNAHAAGKYQLAIERYSKIIERAPENAWAFQNRSFAYRELGENENAENDMAMARQFDPTLEKNE